MDGLEIWYCILSGAGKMKKSFIFRLLLLSLINVTYACTSVEITATDGSVVVGRTLEWPLDMGWLLVVVPKNTPYSLTAPEKLNLKPIRSKYKYAFAGFSPSQKKAAVIDGQNAAGLAMSGNFLPEVTQFQTVNKTDTKYMSIYEFGNWVLGNFNNVNALILLLLMLGILTFPLKLIFSFIVSLNYIKLHLIIHFIS